MPSSTTFPTLLNPVEYYKFKKNFQPKLAPPRKKPANSFKYLQLSPAKFTEVFGLTITPPTLSLGNSNNFTFCDGEWCVSQPKTKEHARRKSVATQEQEQKAGNVERVPGGAPPAGWHCRPRPQCRTAPIGDCDLPRPRPSCRPMADEDQSPPTCRRKSCFQDQEWELAHMRKTLRDKHEQEKRELEETYRRKLQECERCHREVEEVMRREHEAKIQAQQSQVDALLSKCNELKGENNLLHIKVSKMMDMLAECAAEVNLQEAELAHVAQTLQKKRRPDCRPSSSSSVQEEEDYEDDR